jgi:hypothetical protein
MPHIAGPSCCLCGARTVGILWLGASRAAFQQLAIINLTHQPEEWEDCSQIQSWVYQKSPEGGRKMEFRLVYNGPLPAETNRPRTSDKHAIRRAFHPQMQTLWSHHRALRELVAYTPEMQPHWLGMLADEHKVVSASNHIYRFAPLVTKQNYNGCSINILFLRRDMPGGLVKHGGDIDNRIKVLLDALRMPREPQELEDKPQDPDENPLFCLLSDDQFIDQISVTTDRLLAPVKLGETINDVSLTVHVVVGIFDPRVHFSPV